MSIDQLSLHIRDLEILRDYSRSQEEKGVLTDNIKLAKERLNDLANNRDLDKKVSFSKEAPARADHTNTANSNGKFIDNKTIGTITF